MTERIKCRYCDQSYPLWSSHNGKRQTSYRWLRSHVESEHHDAAEAIAEAIASWDEWLREEIAQTTLM